MPPSSIHLRGVRQNNLKGFDLDLPLGHLIVVTGLSGAGKSSLVFDTIHAEGQRRYVETFSPYTRQFLELLDRPRVDSIENIRPSIAIEQRNTVKTSRSTVGTMTELTDYFKIWFAHVATLIDPATGEPVRDDNPASIWEDALARFPGREILLTFALDRPPSLPWPDLLQSLLGQGYTRVIPAENAPPARLDDIVAAASFPPTGRLWVIQDRLSLEPARRDRFIDAATTALHFGQGLLQVFSPSGQLLHAWSRGLHSPVTGRLFSPASPALFSFNSPVGACPLCRGFGRTIEIDDRLVIPDPSLTLQEGAIRPFQGQVYSESLRDLLRACSRRGVPAHVPWRDLDPAHRDWVLAGDEGYQEGDYSKGRWYGVRRFFAWLEENTYKMHVRVFLSKYRAYVPCPACHGARLQPESLLWQWRGHRLPDLYLLPVSDLIPLLRSTPAEPGLPPVPTAFPSPPAPDPAHPALPPAPASPGPHLAWEAILNRLSFLEQVGLGYLTLDRASRTLSGGETMRVNLTACLGTSLIDTLFVLDEPSIGLHARDTGRLISILRRLTALGNTVVVVEHDETVIQAADTVLEIGPRPGSVGGHLVFSGALPGLLSHPASITGAYLSGRQTIPPPTSRRPCRGPHAPPFLLIEGASSHNLRDFDAAIPLRRFVALSGVSGSGKSTLLDNVVYQGLLAQQGRAVEEPAAIRSLTLGLGCSEIVLVDQSPVSRTPRSNPALFTGAWDAVRDAFAASPAARQAGLTSSSFSFNSGDGRCPHCQGLGFEQVEMQFLSDVYIPCPICEGRRFRPEILAIRWNGLTVSDLLALDVASALETLVGQPRITQPLQALAEVGLGYLSLGQPLNTLSGGESQRLKLVKYLAHFGGADSAHALLLLDEPTTGLHRDDVRRLLTVLQKLVDHGHSLLVIEHQLDVLAAADWVLELGPEAGAGGGRLVFAGTPEQLALAPAPTAPFLRAHLAAEPALSLPAAAEPPPSPPNTEHLTLKTSSPTHLTVLGAREHNLQNLSVSIPHGRFCVITGVSGSGKSSLAFDIIFAEGQRRFMESMSSYARQFIEQLPKPDIDALHGIAPTVAIEQRVTRGSRKSTVATITEVAQYLRLLYARLGIQHNPATGRPVLPMSAAHLERRLRDVLAQPTHARAAHLYLFAPLIRGRKGHHQPLADWAGAQGWTLLRIDGDLVPLDRFAKLDRYREHDIELAVADFGRKPATVRLEPPPASSRRRPAPLPTAAAPAAANPAPGATPLATALRLGEGACFLADARGRPLAWFSTTRTDPETGEAFPELDPKHFSWNSAKGWCPTCRGHGHIYDWMKDGEETPAAIEDTAHGSLCPDCQGTRLNLLSRHVRLPLRSGQSLSLPELLQHPPGALLRHLRNLQLDARGQAIFREVLPQIEERLAFMEETGIDYLSLDRATSTLSGGEAQRIRLAAQLGSNLSGVLYVLDEPSIGLHARDNARLLDSLRRLRDKGNSLLVVEHDDDTMRAADHIIDMGPGAGRHGGRILAQGSLPEILRHPDSITARYLGRGIPHPLLGAYRPVPTEADPWLILSEPSLRNLRGGQLRLPLNRLIAVCGVSGAGKSTLIRDLLQPAVQASLRLAKPLLTGRQALASGAFPPEVATPPFTTLSGAHTFRQVIEVDQSPIGKTPRSTPATYLGAFDIIRDLFATLPEARLHGLTPSTFSFNTRGGRCEKCSGAGRLKLEMAFLPETYVDCDACRGRRYGPHLEDIRWKGKNIADVLDLTFEEAAAFFDFHSHLAAMLQLMVETGLGYLHLGQSSPTLSGGEAQRLKLVSELARGLASYRDRTRGTLPRNLYILEEPTIGLHLQDCERLIHLLHRLVGQGHTVILIEHHLDLLAEADYLVEVGPGGGSRGGRLLFQGPLSGLLRRPKSSPTAPFLRAHLAQSTREGVKPII